MSDQPQTTNLPAVQTKGSPAAIPPTAPPNPPVVETEKPADPARKPGVTFAGFSATAFSGPLPPPEILAGYEKVLPGSADRIIRMAETQAAHRQGLEKTVIGGDSRRAYLGLWLGFIVCITTTALGSLLAWLEHPGFGGTIITTSMATVVGIFVYGHRVRKEEREAKAKQMADFTDKTQG